MSEQATRIAIGLVGVALIGWQYRDTLKSWLPSFSPSAGTDSELRIKAVSHIEQAKAIADKLGCVESSKCCRHAAQALWGQDVKPHG